MKRVLLFALLLVRACQQVEHKADGLPQQAEALVQQAKAKLCSYAEISPETGRNEEAIAYFEQVLKGLKETDYVTAALDDRLVRLYTRTGDAQKLYLSVHTVNTHRQRIYSKMDVKNVSDMLRQATELGII